MESDSKRVDSESKKEVISDPGVFVSKYLGSQEFNTQFSNYKRQSPDKDEDETLIKRRFLGSRTVEDGVKEFNTWNGNCEFRYSADSFSPDTVSAITDYLKEIQYHNKAHRRGDIEDNQESIATHDLLRRQYHNEAARRVGGELVAKGVISTVDDEAPPLGLCRGIVSLVAFQKLGVTNS